MKYTTITYRKFPKNIKTDCFAESLLTPLDKVMLYLILVE